MKDSDKHYHPKKIKEEESIDTVEYRLTPVYNRPENTNEGFNIYDLGNKIWNERRLFLKVVAVFFLIGLFIALFSTKQYMATSKLMPEAEGNNFASSLLESYGGLIGVGGNSLPSSSSTINVNLYPDVVNSIPFQLRLMNRSFYFSSYDTTASIYKFYNGIYQPSMVELLGKYTIGLPTTIGRLFDDKLPAEPNVAIDSVLGNAEVINLTGEQLSVMYDLQSRINITLSQGSGIVLVEAELPDPNASAELTAALVNQLKEYITSYRTQKAVEDKEFIEGQFNKAEEKFNSIQKDLAKFRDENVVLSTAQARTKQQRLQSEYDAAYALYNSLQQKLEQAKIKVQEQTPAFKVLQPPTIPLQKSSPNRKLIMILSLILGVLVAGAIIFGKNYFHHLPKYWQELKPVE